MTTLEKYEVVNKCETIAELQSVIITFADHNGNIQGRTRMFKAKEMAIDAIDFYNNKALPDILTREFGIRQQAMYIKYYHNN